MAVICHLGIAIHINGTTHKDALGVFRGCHNSATPELIDGCPAKYRWRPGTERVQALADISHSVLCSHSNETHAPIANAPTVHN